MLLLIYCWQRKEYLKTGHDEGQHDYIRAKIRELARELELCQISKIDYLFTNLEYFMIRGTSLRDTDATAVTEQFVAQAPRGQAECVKDAHDKNTHKEL